MISGTGKSVQGYNLFAYCFNNPINMGDPDGNWPSWKTILKAATVVIAVTAITVAVVATAGAVGVAAGVVSTAIAKAAIIGAATGGIVAGTINTITQGLTKEKEDFSLKEVAKNTIIGGVSGAASGGSSALVDAAASGTSALIAQQGCQIALNVSISNAAYLMSNSNPTVGGYVTSTIGGLVAGVTFNAPFLKGLAISIGIETAGYVEDVIQLFMGNN